MFQLLKEQPEASVKASPAAIESAAQNGTAQFKVQIANGDRFARLLRMRIEWEDQTGQAPVAMYGDNYFDLFPGEEKEVTVELETPAAQAGTTKGTLIVEGTNVAEIRIPVSVEAGR